MMAILSTNLWILVGTNSVHTEDLGQRERERQREECVHIMGMGLEARVKDVS